MTQHADMIPEARPSRAAIALGYEMAMREAADVCTVADGFRRKAAEVAGTKR